ncbi:MAG: hypothetical protein ACR2FY_18110 [Pirellulaceae bacterium]
MVMAAKPEINDVLWECLDVCSDSRNPLDSLNSFVQDLRRSRQWSRREIDEVESTAKMLVFRNCDPSWR